MRRDGLGRVRAGGTAHVLVLPQVADSKRCTGDARDVLEVEREVGRAITAVQQCHGHLAIANGLVEVPERRA